MCGIVGITRRDPALIEKMKAICRHRGPDGEGTFLSKDISLGHGRLAIIDPGSRSNQPMVDQTESIVLIFNGEIYNFQYLRQVLDKSYKFQTKSDTEVILAGYSIWGQKIFDRLNGIFAIALWDTKTQTLYLARDQHGVKPLYYHYSSGVLSFGSEIKSILLTGIKPVLNLEAFALYNQLRYVPGPSTMFKGINQVRPGHVLVFAKKKISECCIQYESQLPKPTSVSQAIAAAVSRQVVSDKPVGTFLSGGLDSTIVTLEARKHIQQLHSFSTIFTEALSQASLYEYNVDADIARNTAKKFGTIHHEVEIRDRDIIDYLERLVWHMDVPVPSWTMLSQYKIAQTAKEFVDVVLAGDGGDEYFGGYTRYRYAKAMQLYQLAPAWLRRPFENQSGILRKLALKEPVDVIGQFAFEKPREYMPLLKRQDPKLMSAYLQQADLLSSKSYIGLLMQFDQRVWLPDYSLNRSDKLSMAHGVELRVPFLDDELVNFARTLSVHRQVGLCKNKRLLRRAYRHQLPRDVKRAPKSGWISPGARWLRVPAVTEYFKMILSPGYYPETASLYNWSTVNQYFIDHLAGKSYHYNVLLNIAVFQVWARKFGVKIE